MIVRSFLTIFSLTCWLVVATAAHGEINADQIRETANQFLARHSQQVALEYGADSRIETSVDRLDSRLSMPDCSTPLQAELKSTRTIGRINIQIRCDGDSPWTLYVPAEAKLLRPVVIVTHPVAKGLKLSADDVELREMDVSQLTGSYFSRIEDVTGMEARRQLPADRPVIATQLKPPLVISKGDAVILTANSPGITVKMPGVALTDGRRGEQISVRNTQSNRIVDAKVTGPGQVEVPM